MFREIRNSEKITDRFVDEKTNRAPVLSGPKPTMTIEEARKFWDDLFTSMEEED